MPSFIGPFTVPLALRYVRAMPRRLLATGLVASMLPDADTLGMLAGLPHGGVVGHRGLTHSIVFALLVASAATMLAAHLRATRRRTFAFVLACALSHPLLDTLTNGGPGIMLGWPFSTARVFAPWRPIEVSPIGAGFFSLRGLEVVASELLWLVLPAILIAGLVRVLRGRRDA